MKTSSRIATRLGRRLSCLIALCCAVAWLACAPAAEEGGEPAADEATEPAATVAGVEAAFQAFVEAWEAEDVEAVAGTFTADAVMFDPVPPVKFSGSEEIRALASGAFESADRISIPVSEVEVETHGPVAWSTARYTYESQADGETTADEGYVSMVWVLQEDGSYKATLFHASHLPEEPPAGAS